MYNLLKNVVFLHYCFNFDAESKRRVLLIFVPVIRKCVVVIGIFPRLYIIVYLHKLMFIYIFIYIYICYGEGYRELHPYFLCFLELQKVWSENALKACA